MQDARRFDGTRLAAHIDRFAATRYAFNLFRFAAICHGINGRLAGRIAASDHASRLVADMPIIAELGWQHAMRARTSKGMSNVRDRAI